MEPLNEINDKHKKQKEFMGRFIGRPVKFFIKHHISPNILSFIGFLLIITAAIILGLGFLYINPILAMLAPVLIILGGLFDIFDGEVARRTESDGPSGAFLDSVLDRISDAVLVLGLIFAGLISLTIGFFMLFFFLMISYIRSRAENLGVEMRGVGVLERADRIIIISAALIAEPWLYAAAWKITGEMWIISVSDITAIPVTPFFFLFIIVYMMLLLITIIQRIVFSYHTLKINAP